MIDVKRNGDKITVSFDANDPSTEKVLRDLCRSLKAAGMGESSERIAAFMADDPPEIPPGG